jgi:aminodeoxyfutalosine deaminase
MCSAPIPNGAVLVQGERIAAVGSWPELSRAHSGQLIDLGDSVLLPGLINAHCHLDYTDMAGLLSPGRTFPDWLKAIVALKAQWSYTDFAMSWLHGAKQLLANGVTTVVNIEAVPELLPDTVHATPLRVISCLELLSIRSRLTPDQLVGDAARRLRTLENENAGLSPHAPYTTSGELLQRATLAARQNHWLLTTHVAESGAEFEMYRHRRGAMYDWLQSQREMDECDGRTPVQHLARNDLLGSDLLAVHANYLEPVDVDLLARSGTHVVHCPMSHRYFGHEPFPYEALRRAGVNVCLGTDSLATTNKTRGQKAELDLFSEIRQFTLSFPNASPAEVLALVTLHPARALRRPDLGVVRERAAADLIAVPHTEPGAYESVLAHHGHVQASMIRGAWHVPPPSS